MRERTDHPTTFRLSEEAKGLLAQLAVQMGMSQAAVIEDLIRDRAEKEAGLTLDRLAKVLKVKKATALEMLADELKKRRSS